MKQSDAKYQVVSLFRNEWPKHRPALPGPMEPLEFYTWVEKNHPHVLEFRCAGDKYQKVKTWIGFS